MSFSGDLHLVFFLPFSHRVLAPSLPRSFPCCPLQWEPVEYFNNKIICDLVEEKHKGIIAILDEECLRPGDVSDDTFLSKLSQSVGNHPHFVSHKTTDYEGRKELARDVSVSLCLAYRQPMALSV